MLHNLKKLRQWVFLLMVSFFSTVILPSCSFLDKENETIPSGKNTSNEEWIENPSEEPSSKVTKTPEVTSATEAIQNSETTDRTTSKENPETRQNSDISESSTPTKSPGSSENSEQTQSPTPGQNSEIRQDPTSRQNPTPEQIAESSQDPAPRQNPTPEQIAETGQDPAPTQTPNPSPTPSPTLPPRGSISLKERAEDILDLIIAEGMKDVDKIKAVHDYIVLNTEYAYDEYLNQTLKDEHFSEEGVLWEGKAVCQGYAYTFQLCMELLGIDSIIVEGEDLISKVNHAWNMVAIDGEWYHVDTTWDDPVPDRKDMIDYKYFLVTDEVLMKDHKWETKRYPSCTSDKYQYYVFQDYMVDSIDQYEEKFMEQYRAGERTITVLYPEEGRPDMSFMLNYEDIRIRDGDRYRVKFLFEPPWRLGDYTVFTVILEASN
ncbi:MAG TPA: hypothetical protein GXZ28_06155 [Clostridiales bacterium]|nr:hypothetical protein [Clostridiales bacterium]